MLISHARIENQRTQGPTSPSTTILTEFIWTVLLLRRKKNQISNPLAQKMNDR